MFTKRSILLLFLATTLTACGMPPSIDESEMDKASSDLDAIKIVTTFSPLHSFTSNVVGEEIEVYNLVEPGASIHIWEPSSSDLRALAEADLLVMNGLGLEPFIEDMIESSENTALEVIVTSDAVMDELRSFGDMIEFESESHEEEGHQHEEDHEHEHSHGEYDPHIWLNPLLATKQVEHIRDKLVEMDPDNAASYHENAKTYLIKLAALNDEIQTIFDAVEKYPFIVFHDAYGYFVDHYGLSDYQKAAIESFPGKEPTAVYFQELLKLIESSDIKIVFTEPQFSPRVVENLKEEVGIMSLEIDPIGLELDADAYVQNLKSIAETFTKAFNSVSE